MRTNDTKQSPRTDFACEIKGCAVYLALRRHNVILVIPDQQERTGFVRKVLLGSSEIHIDEHHARRAYFHWCGIRINFAEEEWRSFKTFVRDKLAETVVLNTGRTIANANAQI